MESRLRDIVQNRAEIKALLKDIPSDTQQKLPWISPHEIHLPQLSYEDIDDPDAINSLIQLHQEIFNNKKVNNQQNSKILVNFNHVDIPDSTPPRPSVSDVRSRIESGLLNIGVYSSDGYNFGLEYHHIYNGETLTGTNLSYSVHNFP